MDNEASAYQGTQIKNHVGVVKNGKPEDSNPTHLRIGFHYGDVILESGEVLCDTANIAAILMGWACFYSDNRGQVSTLPNFVEHG